MIEVLHHTFFSVPSVLPVWLESQNIKTRMEKYFAYILGENYKKTQAQVNREGTAVVRDLLSFVCMQECPKVFSKIAGVPKLLDIIRSLYWTIPGKDSDKNSAGGGQLLEAEVIEIRRAILNMTRILMQSSILNGTWRNDRSWGDIQVKIPVSMLHAVYKSLWNEFENDTYSSIFCTANHNSKSRFWTDCCRVLLQLYAKCLNEMTTKSHGSQRRLHFLGKRAHYKTYIISKKINRWNRYLALKQM